MSSSASSTSCSSSKNPKSRSRTRTHALGVAMPEASVAPGTTPKPKKSVALSGVVAGNTALCTVGRTGNDLHYRGYDILDLAEACEFEEVAYLLIHEHLPTSVELGRYKTRLRAMRGLPAALRSALEC